jgi:hypothetical protein
MLADDRGCANRSVFFPYKAALPSSHMQCPVRDGNFLGAATKAIYGDRSNN